MRNRYVVWVDGKNGGIDGILKRSTVMINVFLVLIESKVG